MKCHCDCHKIPYCHMCNECFVHHGVSLRDWKNRLEHRGEKREKKIVYINPELFV